MEKTSTIDKHFTYFQTTFYASLILLFIWATGSCQMGGADQKDSDLSWEIAITDKDEPGEPMTISGTVYGPDGKTPQPDVKIYVYHTDIHGYYSPNGENERNRRLNGTMKTNQEGKYQYSTIRPGGYPSNRIPAHVHYETTRKDGYEQEFELLFEGDSRITERQKKSAAQTSGFFGITKLTKDDNGVWRGVYDLILKR